MEHKPPFLSERINTIIRKKFRFFNYTKFSDRCFLSIHEKIELERLKAACHWGREHDSARARKSIISPKDYHVNLQVVGYFRYLKCNPSIFRDRSCWNCSKRAFRCVLSALSNSDMRFPALNIVQGARFPQNYAIFPSKYLGIGASDCRSCWMQNGVHNSKRWVENCRDGVFIHVPGYIMGSGKVRRESVVSSLLLSGSQNSGIKCLSWLIRALCLRRDL